MPEDRIPAQVRWHRSVLRIIDEYSQLVHVSRQDSAELLVQVGYAAECKRLGYDRDPVTTARDLLRIIGATWESDLIDDEIGAFGVAQDALDRLVQLRSRKPG
jgi:hypothetical protein